MEKFTVKDGVGFIPQGTKTIPDYAFEDCDDLKSIRIPASVEEIGIGIFQGCSNLEKIEVSPKNKVYESYDRNPNSPKNCNAIIRKEDDCLICGCWGTEIPQYVTKLDYHAFYDCKQEMYFGTAEMTVCGEAFYKCQYLNTVEFGCDVMKVARGAFYHCPNLTTVVFRGDVMVIEPYAFDECYRLTRVDFYGRVMEIADDAFFCTPQEIVVPEGLKPYYMRVLPDEWHDRIYERVW